MRVTLLAGLVACLAVSVSAGNPGGDSDGGDNTNKHTGDATGGTGAPGGDTKSGDSKSDKGGNGGPIGGNQNGGTSNAGGGGTVVNSAPVNKGGDISYGGDISNTIGGGNARGGDNGGNKVGQDNSGASSKGGDSVNKGGDAVGAPGGSGGPGGNTGQSAPVAGNGGYGGAGGTQSLSVPVSPLPFPMVRRSLAPTGLEHLFVRATPAAESITVDEIVGAINKNQKLPGDLEGAFLNSELGKDYKAPANRGPVDPALANQDTKDAVAMVQSGEAKVPPQIISALEQNGWTKVSAAKRDIEWTPRGRTAPF